MHRRILIVFALCVSASSFDKAAATADDHCDETCEQIKFHKVKSVTSDLRETCKEMEKKIDSLETMLESLEEERKWTLAFKVEAGSHICAHCAWTNPTTVNPQSYQEAIDLKKPCGCAFVNHEILSNWTELFRLNNFNQQLTQVSMTFWNRTATAVTRVASVLFDGVDSKADSWFAGKRLRDSSFRDLKNARNVSTSRLAPLSTNTFRLINEERISFSVGDGRLDGSGWMMVNESMPLTASTMKERLRFPRLTYVEDDEIGSWNGTDVRHADLMTIFVR